MSGKLKEITAKRRAAGDFVRLNSGNTSEKEQLRIQRQRAESKEYEEKFATTQQVFDHAEVGVRPKLTPIKPVELVLGEMAAPGAHPPAPINDTPSAAIRSTNRVRLRWMIW